MIRQVQGENVRSVVDNFVYQKGELKRFTLKWSLNLWIKSAFTRKRRRDLRHVKLWRGKPKQGRKKPKLRGWDRYTSAVLFFWGFLSYWGPQAEEGGGREKRVFNDSKNEGRLRPRSQVSFFCIIRPNERFPVYVGVRGERARCYVKCPHGEAPFGAGLKAMDANGLSWIYRVPTRDFGWGFNGNDLVVVEWKVLDVDRGRFSPDSVWGKRGSPLVLAEENRQ